MCLAQRWFTLVLTCPPAGVASIADEHQSQAEERDATPAAHGRS